MPASCPDCGAIIPEGAGWCPACGTGALGPCVVCDAQIPLGVELCPECGTLFRALSGATCEACATPLLRGALFCVACGQKLSGRQAVPARAEHCPQCDAELPERRRHCIFCGAGLPAL